MCSVFREYKTTKIEAKYLVLGDIVLLNIGDRVPADIRLFEVMLFIMLDK